MAFDGTQIQDPQGSGSHGGAQSGVSRRTSVLGVWGARIVLIVVGVCALISVVFILFGASGGTLSRVIGTDVALILFALLVWLDTVIGAHRPEWFEFASLATDAYVLLLWILIIWTDPNSGVFDLPIAIWHGILCLIFIRGMVALADLVRLLFRTWCSTVTRVLAYIAWCTFGVLAVMVTIPAPYPLNGLWDHDIYGRIVAALAVIGGVALVLIPLWGLLINRNRGVRRPAPAPYPAYGMPYGGYPSAQGAGYPQAQGTSYPPAPGYQPTPGYQPAAGYPPVPGYPQPQAQPSAVAAPGSAVPPVPVPPVPMPPAAATPPAVPGAPGAPVPSRDPASASAASVPQTPAAPAPQQAPAAAHEVGQPSHPRLAWPKLRDGRPVPAGYDGKPDFAAVAGAPLAWPTHLDGTPVPASPDGRPLYS